MQDLQYQVYVVQKAKYSTVSHVWWYHSLHSAHCIKSPSEWSALVQGSRQEQYTLTSFCWTWRWRPRRRGFALAGNGVSNCSSKHECRCGRNLAWSRLMVWGSMPLHNAYALAMANSPQSLPPLWRCTSTKRIEWLLWCFQNCGKLLSQGIRTKGIGWNAVVDIDNSGRAQGIRGTHPVCSADVDDLDKVLWAGLVHLLLSQHQSVLQVNN